MKLSSYITSGLFASSIAASLPSQRERAAARINRRAALRDRHSNPLQPSTNLEDFHPEASNSTLVKYSNNWVGAVLSGSGYQSVTGIFTVPNPKRPAGGSTLTAYAASAWVGIDGSTCTSAILQAGVDFAIVGNTVSFRAWYEWWPDYPYEFDGFPVKAGDRINMTVTASGTSSGSAVLQNLSTGKTASKTFTSQTDKLCQTDAEWIVEDYSTTSGLVPFIDFGTVSFTGASVTTTSGSKLDLSGSQVFDIKQEKVYTSCSTPNSSSVTCSYTGYNKKAAIPLARK